MNVYLAFYLPLLVLGIWTIDDQYKSSLTCRAPMTISPKSKQQDKQIGTRPFLILGVNLQHDSEEGIGSKLLALPAGQSL
jgi:hypothetical protein